MQLGGHFKQLVSLIGRLPRVGAVTWLTYDSGLTNELLRSVDRHDDRVVFAPYAAPRDLRNLAADARVVHRVLRDTPFDLAVSTGAGIAVAALPLARSMGVRSCFIESATRTSRPSRSGSLLQRVPGLELFTQNGGYSPRWRYVGSVHDEFARGPDTPFDGELRRVVVTLGTSEAYGFRRLVERLVRILPASAEVLWQTGATDTSTLGIDGRRHVPATELEQAMRDADVVVARRHRHGADDVRARDLPCPRPPADPARGEHRRAPGRDGARPRRSGARRLGRGRRGLTRAPGRGCQAIGHPAGIPAEASDLRTLPGRCTRCGRERNRGG